MNLAISNIAWEVYRMQEYLGLIKKLGCSGLEIAANTIWSEPVETSQDERFSFLDFVKKFGLSIVSMHALTYTKKELRMFRSEDEREIFKKYLLQLIDVANDLQCKILVFGSMHSRVVGARDYEECFRIAVDVFRDIGEYAKTKDIFFCIEPISRVDGCDFITSTDEAYRLIREVNSDNFRLHIDISAMINAGENYAEVFKKYQLILKHIHINDPGLLPPGSVSQEHENVSRALKNIQYEGFLSIEMRRDKKFPQEAVKNALEYVKKIYC